MEFIDVVKLRESTRKFSDEVIPEEVLTLIWLIASIENSTGSSIVIIFLSSLFKSFNKE